jgi:hypothetical protein
MNIDSEQGLLNRQMKAMPNLTGNTADAQNRGPSFPAITLITTVRFVFCNQIFGMELVRLIRPESEVLNEPPNEHLA